MIKKRDGSNQEPHEQEKCIEEKKGGIEEKQEEEKEVKTYKEILGSCGQTTLCQIRRGGGNLLWKRVNIPYRSFTEIAGEYRDGIGYVVQMMRWEFFLLLGIFDDDIVAQGS